MTSLRRRALYFITPSVGASLSPRALVRTVGEALEGGADLVQWRQKPSPAALPRELRSLWEEHREGDGFLLSVARDVRELTKKYGVPFVVNDSVELALALGADGVHIGQSDAAMQDVRDRVRGMEDFLIGVTVRDGAQARAACEGGASYLGAGPVFTSSTKPEANDGNTIGLSGLLECTTTAKEFGVPVYAIGGLSVENGRIRQCIVDGGASGVSMIAAIGSATDKIKATRAIKKELEAVLPR